MDNSAMKNQITTLTELFGNKIKMYKISNTIGTFNFKFTDSYIKSNIIRDNYVSKATISYSFLANDEFRCIFDNIIMDKFKCDPFKDNVPFDGLCMEPIPSELINEQTDPFSSQYDIEINIKHLAIFLEKDDIFWNYFGLLSKYNAKEKFVLYYTCILIPIVYIIKNRPFKNDGWYDDISKGIIENYSKRLLEMNGPNLFFFDNILSAG